MKIPVTIVCICHNHESYVVESLESVVNQSYTNWQLVVVDDGSSDRSVEKIENFFLSHPEIPKEFIHFDDSIGNCRAFNEAFIRAKGELIIDLAADDALLPNRVKNDIDYFQQHSDVSLFHSGANIINAKGQVIGEHVPDAKEDSYIRLVAQNIICPPAMTMVTRHLKAIGGYDESLSYEDFDIITQLARRHKVGSYREVTTKKRKVEGSLHDRQRKGEKRLLQTTYLVCEKIFQMNRTNEENRALSKRVRFEARYALGKSQFHLARMYAGLNSKLNAGGGIYFVLIRLMARLKWNGWPITRLSKS